MVRYPPWHLVSRTHIGAIPHFAAYRARIVRYPINRRRRDDNKIKFSLLRGGGPGGQRGKSSKTLFFRGKRHDNKILKVKILLSRNFVVIAQAPNKNKHKKFCDTIAASIARYEKYRCWASKQIASDMGRATRTTKSPTQGSTTPEEALESKCQELLPQALSFPVT